MAPDTPVNGYWKEQQFALRFQLSDLTLGRVEIPVLAHACSLPEIHSNNQPSVPSNPPRPYRGYLLRSCPGPASLKTIETRGEYVAYTTAKYDHCYIDLRGRRFDDYQAKFSSKSRSTMKRKVRKLEEAGQGAVRFARYATREELLTFHSHARQVSVLTYQERMLDVGLPDDQSFMGAMLEAAAGDRVRAFLIFLGERPVAYLYCPVENEVVVYAYLGFDPALSDFSPGTILLWMSLKSLFDEGAYTYFDFTEGDSPQKRLFSTGQIPCHNTLFLRKGLASQLLLRSHHTFDEGSRQAGKILDRLGLKRKIKHLLRGTHSI